MVSDSNEANGQVVGMKAELSNFQPTKNVMNGLEGIDVLETDSEHMLDMITKTNKVIATRGRRAKNVIKTSKEDHVETKKINKENFNDLNKRKSNSDNNILQNSDPNETVSPTITDTKKKQIIFQLPKGPIRKGVYYKENSAIPESPYRVTRSRFRHH